MRCLQRDLDLFREAERSPLLASHASRLLGWPLKHCRERCHQHYRMGHLCRTVFVQSGSRGRAPFAYYRGRCPAPGSLRHLLGIADVRVESALAFPLGGPLTAEFFYGHELCVQGGLRPDAALVARRGDKAGLALLEIDFGTERLMSPKGYSLVQTKLRSYADYFDAGQYETDFCFAGRLVGFHVGLVVSSPGRLANIRRHLAASQYDFVLLATMDDVTRGMNEACWTTHEGRRVPLFGRGVTA